MKTASMFSKRTIAWIFVFLLGFGLIFNALAGVVVVNTTKYSGTVTTTTYMDAGAISTYASANQPRNLIKGLSPSIVNSNNTTLSVDYTKFVDCDARVPCDLQLPTSTGAVNVTYDLKNIQAITEILLASSQYLSAAISNYEIYVSDTQGILYNTSNKVLSYANYDTSTKPASTDEEANGVTRAQRFDFNASLTGRYIGIKLLGEFGQYNIARVSEIGVYGTVTTTTYMDASDINTYVTDDQPRSLIRGLAPSIVNSNNTTLNIDYTKFVDCNVDTSCSLQMPTSTGAVNVTYDLKYSTDITGLLLATTIPTIAISNYEIYVSDSQSTLYDTASKVLVYANYNTATKPAFADAEANGATRAQMFAFGVNLTGRYIGIKLLGEFGQYNIARVSEIGVYGTVTTTTYADANAVNTYVSSNQSKNMVKRLVPTIVDSNSTTLSFTNSTLIDCDADTYCSLQMPTLAGAVNITYDLRYSTDITGLLLGTVSATTAISNYELYVSDSQSTLYDTASKVLVYANYNTATKPAAADAAANGATRGQMFAFGVYLKGRYIGIKLLGEFGASNIARVSEIAVYGTVITTTYTDTNTINTYVTNNKSISLIKGLVPSIVDSNSTTLSFDYTKFVDCDSSVCTDLQMPTSIGAVNVTYDLKCKTDITGLLLATASSTIAISNYELYVSDSQSTLYDAASKVLVYANYNTATKPAAVDAEANGATRAQIFAFDKSLKGRYIGIKLLGEFGVSNIARVSEIGVYGTVTTTTYTDISAINTYVADNDSRNLIKDLVPSIKDSNSTTLSVDYTKFVDCDSSVCTDVQMPTSASAVNVTYDLLSKTTITGLLLATASPTIAISNFEIYISDSQSTLYDTSNKVLVYANYNTAIKPSSADAEANGATRAQRFAFGESLKGRYIGIKLLGEFHKYNIARVAEIAVYGNERLIEVDTTSVINNDYTGNGVNLIPFTLMPTNIEEGYNMAYWEMDAKRIIMMKPKIVRVWVQVDWMVTSTNSEVNYNNGIYDFNTAYMNALYIYFDAFKKAGTEIQLSYNWKVGANIQSWFSFPGLSDPSCSAPKDLVKYAAAGSALLQELWSRGYDNVKYFTFGNEPNGSWDWECPGDQKAYYVQMVAAVDSKFKADGIRNQVQLWVCESADSWEWTKYMMDNAGEYLDANTYHTYEMSSDEITYLVKKSVSHNPSPFYISEFGEPETSSSTTMWNQGYAGYVINCANAGGSGVLNWTLHGVGGITGYMHLWDPLLTGGLTPNGSYYIWSLMMRYIPSHSSVVKTTVLGDDVRATTFVADDGNITVVAECNNTDIARNLTIDFGNTSINKIFKKHVYSPTQVNYEMNSLIPAVTGSFSCVNLFNDPSVETGYSVVVYTTMDSQTQVAIDDVFSEISATSTVQLSAQVIDNTGGVTWSIAEGCGTITQNGLYTPAASAAPGDMIAVRATSTNDTSAYGVALIKITGYASATATATYTDTNAITSYLLTNEYQNLIKGFAPSVVDSNGTALSFTNSTVYDCDATTSCDLQMPTATGAVNITYDLQSNTAITRLLFATSSNLALAISNYEIYVSDIQDTLYNASNRVLVYSNYNSATKPASAEAAANGATIAQRFDFGDSLTGRYIGIKIVGEFHDFWIARVSEIGIYGNILPYVSFDNYNVSNSSYNIITNIQPDITVGDFLGGVTLYGGATLVFKKSNTTLVNSDKVGTGITIDVMVGEDKVSSYTMVIYGDVDGDGTIGLEDLTVIRDYLLEATLLDGEFIDAGDLYGEGSITLNDLVGLMAYVSGSGTISQDSFMMKN